jgi:DNA-binding MarR family transcriptional regulator
MKSRRRQTPKPHYTMFAVTLASTKRVLALSPPAKRLLIFCHMLWRPNKPIVLPVTWTAEQLRMKPETVSGAIGELAVNGLIEKTREHVPPGAGGKPRAAEYKLVHRPTSRYQANQRPEQLDRTGVRAVLNHGDEVRVGYIKMRDSDLLPFLRDLSNAEFEILWVVAFRNHARDKFGAISESPAMTVTDLRALLPKLPDRTLRHAVKSLTQRGYVEEIIAAAGRRSTLLAPRGMTATGLPWARTRAKRSTVISPTGTAIAEPTRSPVNMMLQTDG